MYEKFFGLKENPFSIAPDPRYLYMSERHRDALAHLLFGIEREGGVVVLTGEVGTGKTTLCRYFLQRLPDNVEMAFILHPKLTARELLSAICGEFGIGGIPPLSNTKVLVDAIHAFLLEKHAAGIHLALLIDEAQNLSPDVLEELRLLTNLETDQKKLLQIILLGQPELRDLLARENLRQLAQRVTARYHLGALLPADIRGYLSYRLSVAGCTREIFAEGAVKQIIKLSTGIPRLINLIADRALLGAYSENEPVVSAAIVKTAAREVGFLTFRKKEAMVQPWIIKSALTGAAVGFLTLLLAVKVLDGRVVYQQAAIPDQVERHDNPAAGIVQGATALQSGAPVPTAPQNEESTSKPEPAVPQNGALAPELPVRGQSASSGPVAGLQKPTISAASQVNVNADAQAGKPSAVVGKDQPVSPFAIYQPGKDNTYAAYLALLRAWSIVENPDKKRLACDFAERYGLRCLHRQGNWRSLLALDRPVVMRLLNDQGLAFQATLISLEKNGRAQVILDGTSVVTDLQELDRRWDGEYSLFYKLPPYQSQRIIPGAVQDADAWINQQINEITVRWLATESAAPEKGPLPPASDARLDERVRWFQSIAGIEQDGVVGTMTIISLNSWLDPTVPRLSLRRKGSGS
jgi:general secretion pathway protein A